MPERGAGATRSDPTTEDVLVRSLIACRDQIEAGRTATLTGDDPEGPHQLRIGLRRLRTALTLFRPVIDGPAARALAAEAQWLGREVGGTRDLEVLRDDILMPRAERSGAVRLREEIAAVRRRGDRARRRLRRTLEADRVGGFLRSLETFVARKGWRRPDDPGQRARLARPAAAFAKAALRRRWKRVRRDAKGLRRHTAEDRHELRKSLKKLRYSTEFLAPVVPRKKRGAFRGQLKKLQSIYGDLNDAAVTERLLRERNGVPADDALAPIVSDLRRTAAAKLKKAKKRWRRLEAVKKPWD